MVSPAMTIPQDLADRLEKAIKALPKELVFFQPSAMRMIELAALCRVHAATILASLRRSAPASGEMREARSGNLFIAAQWFNLASDERFQSACCGAGLFVIRTDKRTYDVVGGKLVERALRTPSGETREEAGSNRKDTIK